MGFSFNFSYGQNQVIERDSSGNWFYELISGSSTSKFKNDKQKIDVVLSNPAVLKVFALNCDLFSLGKINDDFLKTQRTKPNYKQNWTQFMWDYMFYNQLGTAYLWTPNNKLSESNPIQWLNPALIEYNQNFLKRLNKVILSSLSNKAIREEKITYDGIQIPLKEITPIYDLTNSISDNHLKGISRLDALYKIISNSENALDAKNINLEFSRKFLVSSKSESLESVNMTDEEKRSIENTTRSDKTIHAIKKPIDIKRFVDDIARLKLDECFYNDYFMIGSMYNIPRDVLEANLKGSTYENQEKSVNRHVEYVLNPKGKALTDTFEEIFGYKDLVMSWDHLSFKQVFEKERQEVIGLKLANEKLARELNIKIEDL